MKDLLSKIPNFPGILSPGNIDLENRPEIRNEDGSTSTVMSMTVGLDGGKVALIPRIVKGQVLSPEQAIEFFKETKQHMGIFGSQEAADQYDMQMHNQLGWTGPNNNWNLTPETANTYEYNVGGANTKPQGEGGDTQKDVNQFSY